MILARTELMRLVNHNEIIYIPGQCTNRIIKGMAEKEYFGTNSIDVHCTDMLMVGVPNKTRLEDGYEIAVNDIAYPQSFLSTNVPKNGYVLLPNNRYLMCTAEIVGSRKYVPIYDGRSTFGRFHIKSHITAGFGDLGFIGQWTLEIEVTEPTVIYPWMRMGQFFFNTCSSDDYQYDTDHVGHYVASRGIVIPQPIDVSEAWD